MTLTCISWFGPNKMSIINILDPGILNRRIVLHACCALDHIHDALVQSLMDLMMIDVCAILVVVMKVTKSRKHYPARSIIINGCLVLI